MIFILDRESCLSLSVPLMNPELSRGRRHILALTARARCHLTSAVCVVVVEHAAASSSSSFHLKPYLNTHTHTHDEFHSTKKKKAQTESQVKRTLVLGCLGGGVQREPLSSHLLTEEKESKHSLTFPVKQHKGYITNRGGPPNHVGRNASFRRKEKEKIHRSFHF